MKGLEKVVEAKGFDFKHLKEMAKKLNEADIGAKIKLVAVGKEKLAGAFILAIETIPEGDPRAKKIPDDAVDLLNAYVDVIEGEKEEIVIGESKKEVEPEAKESEKKAESAPDNGGDSPGKKKWTPNKWATTFAELMNEGGGEKKELSKKLQQRVGGSDTEAPFQTRTFACILIAMGYAEETDEGVIRLVK